MKKHIALALASLCIPFASAMAYTPPPVTYAGKVEKNLLVDTNPRTGTVTLTNNTRKVINVQKVIFIEEGSRRCTTPNKPTTLNPGETKNFAEGKCGIWSSSEIIFATPEGLIRQIW